MHTHKTTALDWAHPIVRQWFLSKFGEATLPQIQGWPAILGDQHTLISAPTGSGKTFAAFLVCIDRLVRRALVHQLENKTEVVYVSPLKALSNDIHKNLLEPLIEIEALAKKQGLAMDAIRVAVRTGDTLAKERQAMLKKPPHILITTPESFYILLTAKKSRELLTQVKTVIVDEIHAILNDKRGAHLSLSLERLTALTLQPPIRIGLSATQKPIETVAQFLVGNRPSLPTIINIGHRRDLDIAIEVPCSPLSAVASNVMWDEIYDRIAALAKENGSTLVFVNTRRLAERVAHHIAEQLGEEFVTAHHGSLSRKLRLQAEDRLKKGELKVLVATASLELGIDIGSIDLVCQIGSPRAIAVALQRIGRAGHWHGAISKGRIFATTRDELTECASLVYAIKKGILDQVIIPHEPLDILAQQIIATSATDDWQEEALYQLIKQSFIYRNLSRDDFNRIINMLSEGMHGARSRYGIYLLRDEIHGKIKARRNARPTAIMNGGAIPDNGLFTVIAEPNSATIGTLNEDFAIESNRGDIILLGSTSWRIERVESARGRVIVTDAKGAPPSVPFWLGEAPARTQELSETVAHLREQLDQQLTPFTEQNKKNTLQWLITHCSVNKYAATQIIDYIMQGRAILGAVPTQTTIIAERFFDESGGMQLIIHAPFGSRINKAWGFALRKRFCRSFNFELQAQATEDGLNISLSTQHSFPLIDVFQFLHPNSLVEVLTQAVLQSPLFTTRWRWDATRALALLRFRFGKKIPPNIQRMLADDLLAAVFPDAAACQDNLAGQDIVVPDHPLINETMKDVMHEALDVDGLLQLLTQINQKQIRCLAVDTPTPSVFAHEILNANPYAFLDDAPLEERRARAVEMRRILPEEILKTAGKLDPEAIQEVKNQAWPDIRNADELHDFLKTVWAYPLCKPVPYEWQSFFAELQEAHRAEIITYQTKYYWIAAERKGNIFEDEEKLLLMLTGWMHHLGPVSVEELSAWLGIASHQLEQLLLRLETTGMILRGAFRTEIAQTEWCERRLLARIHRLTLDKLRKEIAPVTPEQFYQWLLSWQHLTPDTQLLAEQGLLAVIQQLQGFEAPARVWETIIFPARVRNYQKDFLDRLCLSGVVGWGRLSAEKATRPSSITPITFFVRESSDWMKPRIIPIEEQLTSVSHVARAVYQFLLQKGASFFLEIEKNVAHLKSEIEDALWELVAAGHLTADSFDNLRALINPKRRHGKRYRRLQARFTTARWSLLPLTGNTNHEEQIEAACFLLLNRYGVVFRDLLLREKNIPSWRELLIAFRRLEDRGEIRGGRFVNGVMGEQFALPYAVESLREMRTRAVAEKEINLDKVDPLNFKWNLLATNKSQT